MFANLLLTVMLVRRVRGSLLHEFLAAVHSIICLCGVRLARQETWNYILQRFRQEGCQDLVPHQFPSRQRYIHRLQESCAWPLLPNRPLPLLTQKKIAILEYTRLHDFQEPDHHLNCEPTAW